ncbi:DUF3967 domain-containing protein [Priestia aryabhattai]|jgi:DNA-binding transcriptional MerR regulator|uniref:DUF3967 domain-containing protein n=1 Tax=Priestia aryabhattai TaxID=412384 RepID=UPI00203C03AC|nr:DUF3967 domain-containing protein [Priestia aryabhattai]MCM3256093.1 DUF3967 domain-containing protein [Priestia aryabhattai]
MTDKTHNAIYTSKDVTDLLKIQNSTIRKYCLLLEELGYQFHKNDKGQRGFFDKDIVVLRKLMETKNTTDMTLKQAAIAVMSWENGTAVTDSVTEKERHNTTLEDKVAELAERLDKQQEFNEKLVSYIDNKLDERDKKLMSAMREIQDTQKQLALTEEKSKKKKWWMFW